MIYRPMLCSTKKVLFNSDWRFSPKYDGIRCIAYIKNGQLKLINRSMVDITDRFPEINFTCTTDCVIDGELVCFNQHNLVPDFQLMQTRMNRLEEWDKYSELNPAKFLAFDVLEYNGNNVTNELWKNRQNYLDKLLTDIWEDCFQPVVDYEHLDTAKNLFKDWEGLVAKNIYSTYEPGKRSPNWVKIKFRKTGEFYVSYAYKGIGKRASTFGGLGLIDENGHDCGELGTGYSNFDLQELDELMNKKQIYNPNPLNKKYTLKFKSLKVKASYLELSNTGKVRQGSFEGICYD